MTLSPKQLASVHFAYWLTVLNKIKLQGGIFSLENHRYQEEMLLCESRRKCYMKATQMGITEIEVLESLHGMIYKNYPSGVLYMFPTADDVGEFSKSRFNSLIDANRETIGRYVKTGGRGTDTTSLKKIHDAFLYLRGARLSQTVGIDAKESAKLRSIPVDCVKFDEYDLMDESVVLKAIGRMGHSAIKKEVYLSNPTVPGFGIDVIFKQSDQRHLFHKCECGMFMNALDSFPDCVKLREDGTGYTACTKCGREILDRSVGEWVPAERDNADYMTGWQLSQLNSNFVDPAEILTAFNDPPHGNLGDVYRLKLGLSYVATEDKLSLNTVRECCNNNMMSSMSPGPCAMGVDVGKTKHVVIGTRTGKEKFEIVKAIRVSDWNDIHDLAVKFNVRCAVIDSRPYEDAARAFQKAESYRIYLCEYNENSVAEMQFNLKTGIVKVNRTEICDMTHRHIIEKNIVIPREGGEMDIFIKQLCSIAKVLETNKRTGTPIYRYRAMDDDHYRHALNYFILAATKGHISRPRGARKKQVYADNAFSLTF